MQAAFYISAAVAVLATILMLTRLNAVHALLYLIVSLLAVAVIFYAFGATFAAALEVIIYAGAIMVLFVFAVMTLNLGESAARAEKSLLTPGIWIGPGILAAVLAAEFIYLLSHESTGNNASGAVDPEQVGIVLYGSYLVGVELASMLLLAGLVGAYHLGWRRTAKRGS
jgi:NADH-quinone oxidoreductase subunit J